MNKQRVFPATPDSDDNVSVETKEPRGGENHCTVERCVPFRGTHFHSFLVEQLLYCPLSEFGLNRVLTSGFSET